tara:strand:- start:38 stop:601 length:564 start_codon:yes stop_codon:yes gene_type:complete
MMSKKLKYNKSKTYLLPLLSELLEFDKDFLPFLENTFMFDDLGKYNNCLLMLHDFDFKNPEFTKYEHAFTKNDLFQELIDIDNKVAYVFKFPEEYIVEYDNLINSKYSEFGEDAKELILEFWTDVYGEKPAAIGFLRKLKQILYKEQELRKELEKNLGVKIDTNAELGEFVVIENETFSLKQIVDDK